MQTDFLSISEQLKVYKDEINQQWPELCRISLALYSAQTDTLQSYARSDDRGREFNHFSMKLDDVPSFKALANSQKNAVMLKGGALNKASDVVLERKVESSGRLGKLNYMVPMYVGSEFLGIVFFDATREHYFSDALVSQLHAYVGLIESLLLPEQLNRQNMLTTLYQTKTLANSNPSETGSHLIRMSQYMVIMAQGLADKYGFSEEDLDYLYAYAPMHDIGKLAIPDTVLSKPTVLEHTEYQLVQCHVEEGLRLIEGLEDKYLLPNEMRIEYLKEIIATHHEHWDGNGYPNGLKGEDIPILGRIAAVADVFDALSVDRIYRKALPLQEVYAYLRANKGSQFDPQCVDVFLSAKERIEYVMHQFQDSFDAAERRVMQLVS